VTGLTVAFVSSYTGLGGGETSLLALLGALDRGRIAPVVVCPRQGQLPTAVRRLGIPVHIVPWRPVHTFFVPALAFTGGRALAEKLREIAPAAVHSDYHSLPLVAGGSAEPSSPLVFTCSGWWFRPRPWQRGFFRHPSLTTVASSWAIKHGFLGDPPFMDPARIAIVHPGVDDHRFRPRPQDRDSSRRMLGLDPDAPLVTLVARFQRVKGHDVFLEVARRVLDGLPTTRFAVAGENAFEVAADESYKRQILREVARDTRLRDRLGFLGWVEHSELLLAASDVVVVSSRFESFGMVGVEAMACSVPVVSIDRGGPAETVVDGETGFLVPPERPDAIADRVLRLLRDPELRQRMGTAGRKRVVESFTIGRYAADMTALFEAATAAKR
jgi:glycosyltransferase involved in cell wall biosynthesis